LQPGFSVARHGCIGKETVMDGLMVRQFEAGRRFVGRLPHGRDILAAIESFCRKQSISCGVFSMIGAVSSANIGAYDQGQQVYVTVKKDAPFEILHCGGNISTRDGEPFVHAHIVLADMDGNVTGGHLFSDTILFAGEIDIQELLGPPLERVHDENTGLKLWDGL